MQQFVQSFTDCWVSAGAGEASPRSHSGPKWKKRLQKVDWMNLIRSKQTSQMFYSASLSSNWCTRRHQLHATEPRSTRQRRSAVSEGRLGVKLKPQINSRWLVCQFQTVPLGDQAALQVKFRIVWTMSCQELLISSHAATKKICNQKTFRQPRSLDLTAKLSTFDQISKPFKSPPARS